MTDFAKNPNDSGELKLGGLVSYLSILKKAAEEKDRLNLGIRRVYICVYLTVNIVDYSAESKFFTSIKINIERFLIIKIGKEK